MSNQLVEVWRHINAGNEKSWVLFKNGTCVILTEPEQDLAKQAIELMKEWGPVIVGTDGGDFLPKELKDYPGWVITFNHPDILTYVGPDELIEGNPRGLPPDLIAGLLGRSKRHQDAEEFIIVHIEDKREKAGC
jgi:hypothetical protein